MSEVIRISLVCEGPTDEVIFRIAMEKVLQRNKVNRSFIITRVQPPVDLISDNGNGWNGVRKWCKGYAAEGGLTASSVLEFCDLLVIHIDADVADEAEISCAEPCPPAMKTIKALQATLLDWCGETLRPNKTVFWIPSKNTEAWLWVALYGGTIGNKEFQECVCKPDRYMSGKRYIVNGRNKLFIERGTKKQAVYKAAAAEIARGWDNVIKFCPEAHSYLYKQISNVSF